MFQNFSTYLLILVMASTMHYLIPRHLVRARQVSLLLFSAFFLLSISPASLFIALIMFGLIYAYVWGHRAGFDSNGPAILTTACLIFAMVLTKYLLPNLGVLETIGISYVLLKCISVVWFVNWRHYKSEEVHILDMLALVLFFPMYTAGPIERMSSFTASSFAKPFMADEFLYGIYRILQGIFKSYFLAILIGNRIFAELGMMNEHAVITSWFVIWMKFLVLYLGFSGYSDIAIGSGRLFGLTIMENFKMPYISASIREFWTRWHLSLGKFISSFLFFPLVKLSKGKPYLPIFISFVLVGLWHNISWTYLIWGAGHGGLLAAYHYYDKKAGQHGAFNEFRTNNIPWYIVSVFITVSYVSVLSAFANSKDLDHGLQLMQRLVGI